jgi:hypothetical protein
MSRARAAAAATALAVAAGVADASWVGRSEAPYVASAPLAIRLDVERFLMLQVGTPGSVIDTVRFDLGAIDQIVGPTASGGATVRSSTPPIQVLVQGNAGSISLSVDTRGSDRGLRGRGGSRLSFDTLQTVSDNPMLPAPRLTDDGGSTVIIPATAWGGRVTNQAARWSFVYASPTLPPPGTYTGQVTYTASMP